MLCAGWLSRYSDWLRAERSGDRIPVGARFSVSTQNGPGVHPASCTMGTEYFPGVKSGRGVTLTPHPFLVPWSRKSRGIPLLPLLAVRSVQSLSACTRVHFTLPYFSLLASGLLMPMLEFGLLLCSSVFILVLYMCLFLDKYRNIILTYLLTYLFTPWC